MPRSTTTYHLVADLDGRYVILRTGRTLTSIATAHKTATLVNLYPLRKWRLGVMRRDTDYFGVSTESWLEEYDLWFQSPL